MPYVQGHSRGLGWVLGHHRRPHLAEDGQLPLAGPEDRPVGEQPAVPSPRQALDEAVPDRRARPA